MVNRYVKLLFRFFAGSSLIGAVIIPAHSRISISPTSTAPGTRMSVEGYLDLIKMYWPRRRHDKQPLNNLVSVILNLFSDTTWSNHVCKLGQHRFSLLLKTKISATPKLPPFGVWVLRQGRAVLLVNFENLCNSQCWLISNYRFPAQSVRRLK